jgi:hypothetical protein
LRAINCLTAAVTSLFGRCARENDWLIGLAHTLAELAQVVEIAGIEQSRNAVEGALNPRKKDSQSRLDIYGLDIPEEPAAAIFARRRISASSLQYLQSRRMKTDE